MMIFLRQSQPETRLTFADEEAAMDIHGAEKKQPLFKQFFILILF